MTKTVRLVGRCKTCGAKFSVAADVAFVGNVVALTAHSGIALFPTILNSDEAAKVACPCGKFPLLRKVFGKFVAEKVCDGRCMGATGPNCDCSCGGHNHGAAHAA